SLGPLAIRFFLVGIIVILMRGIVTEIITVRMMKAKGMAV
ncbi:PTS glucitol/sorbitol transporter subunit IIC, partial [Bacillus sp. SIMBA_161]